MKKFHTTKQRTVTDIIPYKFDEFENALLIFRPKLIFNSQYSQRIPLIVITEYVGQGFVGFYTSAADKTPRQFTFDQVYNELKYSGLADCYIEEDKDFENDILEMSPNFPPSRCPVTGRSFFMYIKDPNGKYVATYGGPKDSYTLAVKVDDEDEPNSYSCERFDHDEGGWTETENISLNPELDD